MNNTHQTETRVRDGRRPNKTQKMSKENKNKDRRDSIHQDMRVNVIREAWAKAATGIDGESTATGRDAHRRPKDPQNQR